MKLRRVVLLLLVLLCLDRLHPVGQDGPQNTAALNEVARAVLAWDGTSPAALAERVKQLVPDAPVIDTLRVLNLAHRNRQLDADVQRRFSEVEAKQRTYQGRVRDAILRGRQAGLANFLGKPAGRALSAIGDSGSWPDQPSVKIESDFDFTIFGADVNVTRAARDACGQAILRELGTPHLQLGDFDIVVTAEGAEVESCVFETEGGIDWAKRNLKRIHLIYPDGTMRLVELWRGDPSGELAYASMMARLRQEANRNGDYEKMFDARGLFRDSVFKDTSGGQGQTLWQKYRHILEGLGVDYFRSRTSTAPGGCLDMAKHLRQEVLDSRIRLAPEAKMKRILKYLPRAHSLAQAAPGVSQLIAADPILSDPSYASLLDLARAVEKASPAEITILLKQRFGDYPDAGLQELGNRVTEMVLRYSEVAFQVEVDRILLQEATPASRRQALDKLSNDFRIIEGMGGAYAEHARAAQSTIEKIRQAEADGSIDALRAQRVALEKIRQTDEAKKDRLRQFLELTELGQQLLEFAGKLLDIGRVFPPAEGRYRSGTVETLIEVGTSARAHGMKVVDYMGSATMWASVFDNISTAQSDLELVMALSRTLVEETFFGMVYQSLYAFVYQGDNKAFLRAVMYLLVPETALPALVEALGETTITVGAQMLFDGQLERLYVASRFDDEGRLIDLGGLGKGGLPAAQEFVASMCNGEAELVAKDFIDRSRATEFGQGANRLAIVALAKAVQATVLHGRPGLFTQDGPLMRACEGIRRVNEDITYLTKAWGIELPADADTTGGWATSLDPGQRRALDTLLASRATLRRQAEDATAEAIVRTFEDRRSAELALDTDRGRKALEQYERLLAILRELEIVAEGEKHLDAEGAPYNSIKGWLMSTRDQQVAAVKAVQKFLRTYETILQARGAVESSMVSRLGRVVRPRPLTRSLPLTGKPEIDADTLRHYIAGLAQAEASTIKDLELIKRAKLEGDYDTNAQRQLYDYRAQIAHWSATMSAAQAAQSLRWRFEVFEKQRLLQRSVEAKEEIKRLRDLERILLEKFRAYYTLGDLDVQLTGPAEAEVGQAVNLRCTVRARRSQPNGQPGSLSDLPPDLAQQLVYAWRIAQVDLGTDKRAERTYRLETPGAQTYSVTVKRPRQFGGDDVLGTATLTITVKKPAEGKPADSASQPPDQPPDDSGGAAGKGRFSAVATGNWEGGNTKDGFILNRKPAAIKGPCGWDSRVTATIRVYVEQAASTNDPKTPQAARAWCEKLLKERPQGDTPNDMAVGLFKAGGVEGVNALTIGDFEGALADFAIWVRRGTGGFSGYTGSYMGAGGRGQAIGKSGRRIVVHYSVSGSGCWDNSDRSYLIRQCEAAQREAKAIIGSLRLDLNGQLTTNPYQGPKYDGSDLPRVTLVPNQVRKLRVGERLTVRAMVENAEPADAPYKYNWSGDIKGDPKAAGDTVTLEPKAPGKFTLSVGVEGARYGLGWASLEYEVAEVRVTVERLGNQNQPILLGSQQNFVAKVTVDGKPATGNYTFRWQPHPETQFTPFESNTATTAARFGRPGSTKVWVEVLEKVDGQLMTVATSPQLDLAVTAPKFELKAPTDAVLVGQDVVVSLVETPPLAEGLALYWWETTPSTVYGSPTNGDRAYQFKPRDTKPVTITAHIRARDGGDEIGTATCQVTATALNVAVVVTGPEGPPPRAWKEGVGLVPVERAIATHQFVGLRADVSPLPPGGQELRYEWSLNTDSHFAGGGFGRDIRAYRSQVGTCVATVIVRNADGVELGRGQGSFEVTLDRDRLNTSNKEKEAAAKLAQARAAHAAGRLDEAIQLASAAAAIAPHQTEARTTADRWRQDRESIHQHLQSCEQLLAAGRLDEARTTFEKASAIHRLYPPVVEMEKRLTAAAGRREQRVRQALDRMAAFNAEKNYAATLAEAQRLRRETPLQAADEARVQALEAAARAGEAERERVLARLRRGEARFNAYDYTGALADLGVIFDATCFGPNAPEPAYYRNLGNEAAARLERINTLLPNARAIADNPRATRPQLTAALMDVEEVLRLQPPNQEAQACRVKLNDRLARDLPSSPPSTPPPGTRGGGTERPPSNAPPRNPPPGNTVTTVFNNGNVAAVDNGPTRPTQVTFKQPYVVTYVFTYHWNYGRGAAPGTIGLLHSSGKLYGPWRARGTPGQGGVPNANWECTPNVVVPAGTYTVVDSDPATWAQNSGSGGAGIAIVKGYPAEANTPPQPPSTPPATPPTGGGRTGSEVPRLRSIQGTWHESHPDLTNNVVFYTQNGNQISVRGSFTFNGFPCEWIGSGSISGNKVTHTVQFTRRPPDEIWRGADGRLELTLSADGNVLDGMWFNNNGHSGPKRLTRQSSGRQTPPPSNPPSTPPGGGRQAPPPTDTKTIEVVFRNASSLPVHLCLAGTAFSPENRVAPGETRTVRVPLPSSGGRLRFVAGRNGQVIATGDWYYDPDAPSRYPVVTFPDDNNPHQTLGKLLITTGLK
ncbi:MAG: hypothetical protein SNJ49_05395 [Chloracidobacterium sp.]